MSINFVEAVQTKLGYPPLHKVNPNTQEVINDGKPVNYLAQAAIPAVLLEMYKLSTHEGTAAQLLRGNSSTSVSSDMFGQDYDSVLQSVASYANTTTEEASAEMDKIAVCAQDVLRNDVKATDGKGVKTFFTTQIANLKKYLPGALHIGDALKDNTLDDRTHKMEGPMSNAMHAIESLFSDGSNQKKPFNPTDDTIHYK